MLTENQNAKLKNRYILINFILCHWANYMTIKLDFYKKSYNLYFVKKM
jgi:hypothetical protein